MIQERIRQGVYVKDVAAELGVHPRTVSRALGRGDAPPRQRPSARKSKLDKYKPMVDRLLAEGVWNARVILREIQAQGYGGRGSILRDYVRPKRPLRAARATVRFETMPGEQLQNDWAQYRTLVAGGEQLVHFAVNTLGYSRRFHFVAMECEDAEHTYESLILSLEYFGGVTREVLVDNQKAEVISHRAGAAVEFNPRFLELAAHCGFQPRACRPRRARTKGKDERMVRYIKENFFLRYRQFESLAHLNQLITRLRRAQAENRLEWLLAQWITPKLLVVDELGYLPMSREEANLFFRLVARRYERASLIITSNKSFIDWGEVFGDQVLATAILDRLLHHSCTINIKGESFRLKEKRRAGLLGQAAAEISAAAAESMKTSRVGQAPLAVSPASSTGSTG
jgi:transposase